LKPLKITAQANWQYEQMGDSQYRSVSCEQLKWKKNWSKLSAAKKWNLSNLGFTLCLGLKNCECPGHQDSPLLTITETRAERQPVVIYW